MGQALYRKHRPKRLDDVIGQEHITQTLSNALKNGKISHAYLLTGPKGVGKTSIARILAHEVNGLDYDDDTNHLDIIEIDAASNRRIDEIRELRERVHIAPTSAKYKVYIIDEVHMLTKEAFNALLKTLEEPPEHVIFILATTESHKLPDTIVSRTQRFNFKPIDTTKAVEHLKQIAKTEKLHISDAALKLIAEHGDGSFRDSISLLDQVRNIKTEIELDDVQQMLGIAPEEAITELMSAITSGQPKRLIETLKQLYEQGYQPTALANQLLHTLRYQLLNDQLTIDVTTVTSLMHQLIEVSAHTDPQTMLEITLLGYMLSNNPTIATTNSAPTSTPPAVPVAKPAKVTPPVEKEREEPKAAEPAPEEKPPKITSTAQKPFNKEAWPDILNAIKTHRNTLYSIIRMASVEFTADTLILTFSFPFHQKRLMESKNQQVLRDTVKEVTGQDVKLECLVKSSALPPKETPPKNAKEAIDTISDIFGGAEVIN